MSFLRISLLTAFTTVVAIASTGIASGNPMSATLGNKLIIDQSLKNALDLTKPRKIDELSVRIQGSIEGSGVIVDQTGDTYTVLTAWHVLSPNKVGEEISIQTSDRNNHATNIESAKRIGDLDIAIIKFNSVKRYPVIKLEASSKLKTGLLMYTAGYPNESREFTLNPGFVVAHANVGIDQGYELLHSSATKAGMSGGALINSDGNLIGIHGRGERSQRQSESLKTGVNQAIPIEYYLEYKKNGSIRRTEAVPSSFDDYYALATNAARIEQPQTVLRLTEQMRLLEPLKLEIYYLSSNAYTSLGQDKKSKEQEKKMNSLFKIYQDKVSRAALTGKKLNKSIRLDLLEESLAYTSIPSVDISWAKSNIYFDSKNYAKAIKHAEATLEMGRSGLCTMVIECDHSMIRSFYVPYVLNIIGWSHFHLGDSSSAIKYLDIAQANARDDFRGLMMLSLGEVAALSGETYKKTCEIYKKALSMMDSTEQETSLSARGKTIMYACQVNDVPTQVREKLFEFATLKSPRPYINTVKPIIPHPEIPEVYKRNNEGFITLAVIFPTEEPSFPIKEDLDNPKRYMLHKPSVMRYKDWLIAYTTTGDIDYGSHGKFNTNRVSIFNLVNCNTHQITAAYDFQKHGGAYNAVLHAINNTLKMSKHGNDWWMNEYMVKRFLSGSPIHNIISNQKDQAIYDYFCSSGR